MSLSQILVTITVVLALSLVAANRLRVDIAALSIAVVFGLAQFAGLGILDTAGKPDSAVKAISGFGQPVVITLLSLFILTRCLEKSGITRWIAGYLIKIGRNSEARLIALFAAATALLSLFMNNLAAGALLLPGAMEAARRTGIKPSKLLIPVAYGSLLGGSATYFTTANIIVSNLLVTANPPQRPLNVLDFTSTGGLIALAGILFLGLFGKHLLPDRSSSISHAPLRPTGSDLEDAYQLSERLWEGFVQPGSPLVRQTLAQAAIGEKLGAMIVAIDRRSELLFPLSPEETILAYDSLILVGRLDQVMPLSEQGVMLQKHRPGEYISPRGLTMIEVVPAPRSAAVGKSMKELSFRTRYGFSAIALWRQGHSYRTQVADIQLEWGDSLLLIGAAEQVTLLRNNADFIVLESSLSDQPVQRKQAFISIAVVFAAVAASIAGVPVYLSMLAGAILVILIGLVTAEEAYRSVEWQAIFLIAGMYSVSIAMVQTGLAEKMGGAMLTAVTPFGPLGLAAGAYLLTAALTQVMGGQVTALVTGPIAISAAISLHTNPQAIAVATAIGCSASFLTPLAHPVNILMMAPANYTFTDFFHIGWRLTVLSFIMLLIGMFLFWHL